MLRGGARSQFCVRKVVATGPVKKATHAVTTATAAAASSSMRGSTPTPMSVAAFARRRFSTAATARTATTMPPVAHLTTTASANFPLRGQAAACSSASTTPSTSRDCTPPVSRPCRRRSATPSVSTRRSLRHTPPSLSQAQARRSLSTASSSSRSSPLARRTLMHGSMAAAMPMRTAHSHHLPLPPLSFASAQRAAASIWPSGAGLGVDAAHLDVDVEVERAAAASTRSAINSAMQRLKMAPAMAASVSPKKALREKAFLQFDVGTAAYPHPKRMRTGSEDAFFTSRRTGSFVSSGVADGVASVRMKYGLDPSKFSRALCDGAHRLSSERLSHYSLNSLPTPDEMFDAAVDHARTNNVKGCATLTVLTLNGYHDDTMPFDTRNPAGELNALSLGDSQFIVIHNDVITHKAFFQQHAFGHPYQLGNGEGLQNDPRDEAIRTRLPVYTGDTVIIGSDGLFDNAHDADLLAIALEADSQQRPASSLAMQLADFAYSQSTDRNADTPYSLAASRHLDHPFSGGNRDDITVIVAKVHDLPNSSLF